MSTNDTTYNGWTNYATWAVKLWMDNDQGSLEYWSEQASDAWDRAEDRSGDRSAHARSTLSDQLEHDHSAESEHPVFTAAEGTVYADLLTAALGAVNWREIANALLEESDDCDGYEPKG